MELRILTGQGLAIGADPRIAVNRHLAPHFWQEHMHKNRSGKSIPAVAQSPQRRCACPAPLLGTERKAAMKLPMKLLPTLLPTPGLTKEQMVDVVAWVAAL